MNDKIQSDIFVELIKFFIIVSVILHIFYALNFVTFAISLLCYLLLVKQTHDISIKFVNNNSTLYFYLEKLSNSSPCGDYLFL